MNIPLFIAALFAGAAVIALLAWRGRQRRGFWLRLALAAGLVVALSACALVNAVVFSKAYTLVYPGKTPAQAKPESAGINDYLDVRFTTPDGYHLAAWYLPPENGAVVIAAHGFAANRAHFLPEAAALQQAGFGVLLYDARWAGESDGSLHTFGLQEVGDIRGALDFLRGKPGIDPARIGLLGHSSGSSTALHAAAQIPTIAAVAAQSTFTSLEDNIDAGMRVLVGLPPFPFAPLMILYGESISGLDMHAVRPIEQVGQIAPRPLLLIQGAEDNLTTPDNARAIFAAAGEPKELYLVPGAGHDTILVVGGQAYLDKLVDFFRVNLLANH